MEAGVQSLAWHSRLKKGSSFAATAVYVETIAGSQSLALELPYAMGVAKKKKKKEAFSQQRRHRRKKQSREEKTEFPLYIR